jgi:hypothetical protein
MQATLLQRKQCQILKPTLVGSFFESKMVSQMRTKVTSQFARMIFQQHATNNIILAQE